MRGVDGVPVGRVERGVAHQRVLQHHGAEAVVHDVDHQLDHVVLVTPVELREGLEALLAQVLDLAGVERQVQLAVP